MATYNIYEAKANFSRLGELPITFAHAEQAAHLEMIHGDPFDRMLVSQAMVEGMVLVTANRKLVEYPVSVLQV